MQFLPEGLIQLVVCYHLVIRNQHNIAISRCEQEVPSSLSTYNLHTFALRLASFYTAFSSIMTCFVPYSHQQIHFADLPLSDKQAVSCFEPRESVQHETTQILSWGKICATDERLNIDHTGNKTINMQQLWKQPLQ